MSTSDQFLAEAADLLGPRGLTRDPDLMAPWLTDWRGRFTGEAMALASPASTEEVSALVKLCAAHGVPIVAQGGNTGMCGGATPDGSGNAILLSLRRMNAIRRLDTEAREAVCEAGVILQTLHEAAEAEGLRFPLTLGGKGSATIGGLVSTNAGGTQVLRHGSMRAQVLGIEAVLADGSVFNALPALKKDNRGFDLKQLLIGSEGTLGIVTAATLRLLPAIGERRVVWAGVPSLPAARKLLLHCQNVAGDALEGFEVIPAKTLGDVVRHLPDAREPLAEPHAWHALIELVAERGDTDRIGDLAEDMLSSAFEAGLLEDAVIAANERQAEDFWLLRDSIAPAEREKGPAVQHDISVPVDRMPEVRGIRRASSGGEMARYRGAGVRTSRRRQCPFSRHRPAGRCSARMADGRRQEDQCGSLRACDRLARFDQCRTRHRPAQARRVRQVGRSGATGADARD